MHPRGTLLETGLASIAEVAVLLVPVHSIYAASPLRGGLVQAELCVLWPERHRPATVEAIGTVPRLCG
jgi:hypothetical protein